MLFVLLLITTFLLTPINSNAVTQATPPISGTFIVPDLGYTSESEYLQFMQELKDTGVDTVIVTMTDSLKKDCNTGNYKEEDFSNTAFSGSSIKFLPTITKQAKSLGIKIFFSLGNTDAQGNCFIYHQGKLGDESTDKGKLIATSIRTIDRIKKMTNSLNITWNDQTIAGFYIAQEESTQLLSVIDSQWGVNYPQFKFFKELSQAIKTKEPFKKILLSPFQLEQTDYTTSKTAFTNLYKETSIDIIAPQDSLGTKVTTTFTRSQEHFQALRDAVTTYPTKQAWANIETFSPGPTGDGFVKYIPSDFSKVKQQISITQPYVTKTITWIYQHTMLSLNTSDNMASKNIYSSQYTPTNAILRKRLRSDYLSYYGINSTTDCSRLYFFNKNDKTCRQTSGSYHNQTQTSCTDNSTCKNNLEQYLPNQTSQKCYTQLESCYQDNLTPTTIPTKKNPTPTTKLFFTPTIPAIPTSTNSMADANHDRIIDIIDYSIWYQEFNSQNGNSSDFTGPTGIQDNIVDIYDYSLWLKQFIESI